MCGGCYYREHLSPADYRTDGICMDRVCRKQRGASKRDAFRGAEGTKEVHGEERDDAVHDDVDEMPRERVAGSFF